MNRMQQIRCHLTCLTRQIIQRHVVHVSFHVRGIARALHARHWEATGALP